MKVIDTFKECPCPLCTRNRTGFGLMTKYNMSQEDKDYIESLLLKLIELETELAFQNLHKWKI